MKKTSVPAGFRQIGRGGLCSGACLLGWVGLLMLLVSPAHGGSGPRVVTKAILPVQEAIGQEGLSDPGASDWKGHGARADRELYPQMYHDGVQPVPLNWFRFGRVGPVVIAKKKARILVDSVAQLIEVIGQASAGDVIQLAPGRYPVKAWCINVRSPGTAENPITVTAEKLGSVFIELDTSEGFLVDAPFWIFENLDISGPNPNHNENQHAFHVIGKAKGFVVRNCRVHEFNAMIKANGTPQPDGSILYPDHALIQDSSFYNSQVRQTAYPVTLIDVVTGNDWIIRGNLICDFAKGLGDNISYGAFIKGNGRNGIFENNLVIGEYRTQGGTRVGLSFGGGGTGVQFARDQQLPAEHTNGILRNNLIMYCSDVGIYLNRSANTKIFNNTLYKTMGIDIRFEESDAVIRNTLSTSRFKNRDKGRSQIENSRVSDFQNWFQDPGKGDFTPLNLEDIQHQGLVLDEVFEDICGNPRQESPDLGAMQFDRPLCQLIRFR